MDTDYDGATNPAMRDFDKQLIQDAKDRESVIRRAMFNYDFSKRVELMDFGD